MVENGEKITLMKIYNQTSDTCESSHIDQIYSYLTKELNNEWGLYIRRHEQPVFNLETKYGICVILSAEGHSYIPPETKFMDTFMNYLPKQNHTFPYFLYPDSFVRVPRLFELQLGVTAWFTGDHYTPINNRKYDFSFIGQYDPYTRPDFYRCATNINGNGFIHFYEGWNKGLGPEKYSEIMSQTKIALVPCGSASLDTFRFYEAMSCGCAVLSVSQNNYEFMQNSPHICIQNWNSVMIEQYIKNLSKEELEVISIKSRNFWETNLSPKAASKFILNKVKI